MLDGIVSAGQVFKNISKTGASVAAGTAGWMGGAAAGAAAGSVIPVIGTAAGGIIGGLLGAFGGGMAGQEIAGAILDEFIEDDAVEMMNIFEKVYGKIAFNYLLSEEEALEVIQQIESNLGFEKVVQDMFMSDDRGACAREILVPIVEKLASKRPIIKRPNETKFLQAVGSVVEEITG